MKMNSNDQRLEILIREIVSAASVDESILEEVASSPTVWKNVQREIRKHEPASAYSFAKVWRWLLIGVPAATAAALLITLFVSRSYIDPASSLPAFEQAAALNPEAALPTTPETIEPTAPETMKTEPVASKVNSKERRNPGRVLQPTTRKLRQRSARPQTLISPSPSAESAIKSEFIALSYARDPESGQIIRVKVPRSMMVTVGLVASVEKPTALVDAEVLIGDDGMTRAIRFIR